MNIQRKVEKLIEEHGTCDPFRLCDELGIILITHPLGTETRGIIRIYKDTHIICINTDMSEVEQQFTCAHELGHFILHRNINTLFLRQCTLQKTDRYELQADQFAEILINYLYENI